MSESKALQFWYSSICCPIPMSYFEKIYDKETIKLFKMNNPPVKCNCDDNTCKMLYYNFTDIVNNSTK
jgi:hypothetical protein